MKALLPHFWHFSDHQTMGVEEFFKFFRYVARPAIAPALQADGSLSVDYAAALRPSLEQLDAVIVEAMHRVHVVAHGMHADDPLPLFFQRLMYDIMSEACAPQRVSIIVLLFDSATQHPMKSSRYTKILAKARTPACDRLKAAVHPPTFAEVWLDDREARSRMMDLFREWLPENASVRGGLNLVVHGLYAEPVVFWRDEHDNRHMSTPIERNLMPVGTRWPTTCYEADDLVMLWVKALLVPCDGGGAYNMMVVANDSDILMDLLMHASIVMMLPADKQPRSRAGANESPICLFRTECMAGKVASAPPGARDADIRAPEYVQVFAAADILATTFAPALMRIAPASQSFPATTVLALMTLWLCHHHDYMPDTWVPFCADVHVWFPMALQAIAAGDAGAVLETKFCGEPGVWTPVEVRVSGTGLHALMEATERRHATWKRDQAVAKFREQLDMLEKNGEGTGTSGNNVRMKMEQLQRTPIKTNNYEAAIFHAQAARMALWLAKRLNNHLPGWRNGKGLPSELEKDGGQSRWGYEWRNEAAVQNDVAIAVGFAPIPNPPPVCVATDAVTPRAFYSVV